MKYLYLTLCLFACLSALAYNDHRNARIDSLEAALKSNHPPKGDDLLFAYDELMRGWLPYDGKKAEYYGRKALALSYQQDGLNVRQNILRLFAQMHYAREEHDEAIRLFQWALAVVDTMEQSGRYKQMDIDDARSCTYGAIGNDYNIQDKHHLAIHYYQLALPIFEKYNWTESQTILYHNIGELYLTMGNLQEAERNYLMAVKKSEASGDSLMMAIARKGLFKIYTRQDDYKQAKATAEKCYAYYHPHRTEEPEDYPVVLAAMTRLNMMNGHENLTVAKTYIQEALTLADSLRFEDKSDVYAAACEVAMAEQRWQEALEYALKSVRHDSAATIADKDGYMLLAEIYAELGDKTKAREYMNKAHDLMNRYATDHYQSGLSQMEVLYETVKKEARIAQLASEQRLWRWLLCLAVALLAAAVALMVYLHLAHRRQKALLAAKVALETEAKERHILARELHDSLGGMLSLLRLKIGGNASKDETLRLLDTTHTELRRISHHLMPEELLRGGLVSALRDFARSVPGAAFQTYGDIRLSKEWELTLYRCAYELVNNAMKYAEATHIDVQLMQTAHEVTLTVSDNGKGMGDGNGMGLQNIRERIEPYHGTLRIVSGENEGTEINLTLPL
ncbi:MAG: tetratricopeptide repeat protein [Tidjanibacter sp.]|nr:tetratricopeptide repeat protein [Tidjanibacter sp.]